MSVYVLVNTSNNKITDFTARYHVQCSLQPQIDNHTCQLLLFFSVSFSVLMNSLATLDDHAAEELQRQCHDLTADWSLPISFAP